MEGAGEREKAAVELAGCVREEIGGTVGYVCAGGVRLMVTEGAGREMSPAEVEIALDSLEWRVPGTARREVVIGGRAWPGRAGVARGMGAGAGDVEVRRAVVERRLIVECAAPPPWEVGCGLRLEELAGR